MSTAFPYHRANSFSDTSSVCPVDVVEADMANLVLSTIDLTKVVSHALQNVQYCGKAQNGTGACVALARVYGDRGISHCQSIGSVMPMIWS